MSFFDDANNAGLALIIVSVFQALSAVIMLGTTLNRGFEWAVVLLVLGQLVCSFLYFKLGIDFRAQPYPGTTLLSSYIRVVGMATIIIGVASIGFGVFSAMVNVAVGLVIFWIYLRVDSGKGDNIDRVLWYVLVLAFVIMCISSFGSIVSSLVGLLSTLSAVSELLTGIANLFIGVFMLLVLLENAVRMSMGT